MITMPELVDKMNIKNVNEYWTVILPLPSGIVYFTISKILYVSKLILYYSEENFVKIYLPYR